MSALLIVTVVLASVAFYCAAAGAVGLGFYRDRTAACDECTGRKERAYSYGCSKDHETGAAAAGVLWPFALPMLLGMSLIDRAAKRDRRVAALHDEIERLEKDLNIGERRG